MRTLHNSVYEAVRSSYTIVIFLSLNLDCIPIGKIYCNINVFVVTLILDYLKNNFGEGILLVTTAA